MLLDGLEHLRRAPGLATDLFVVVALAAHLGGQQVVERGRVVRRDEQAVVPAAAQCGGLGPPGDQVGVLVLRVAELEAEVVGHAPPTIAVLPQVCALRPSFGGTDGGEDADTVEPPLGSGQVPVVGGHVVVVGGAPVPDDVDELVQIDLVVHRQGLMVSSGLEMTSEKTVVPSLST